MRYAVLIPSRSRAGVLLKLFRRCPSLHSEHTFVSLESKERKAYADWIREFPSTQIVWIDNPYGKVSVAREALRRIAVRRDIYDRYVLSDDDIVYNDQSLRALVESHQKYSDEYGECVVAGLSSIYRFYNREKVEYLTRPINNYHTYPGLSTVFWCVPNTLYDTFTYPDCEFDDIYLQLYAIRKGIIRWRVCVEAIFEQVIPRWGSGGLGSVAERVEKLSLAMARIARDFPEWMTPATLRCNFRLTELIDLEAERQRRLTRKEVRHE